MWMSVLANKTENTPENAKKQQPTENKNARYKMLAKGDGIYI